MAMLSVLELLQYDEEKNLLIQGLPSSVEKPFAKMNYAKSVTPLLRSRKIDFALMFAVNVIQLKGILADVIPALSMNAKVWVAFPKRSSKIYSELCRDYNWEATSDYGYEGCTEVSLDSMWSAIKFEKKGLEPRIGKNINKLEAAL